MPEAAPVAMAHRIEVGVRPELRDAAGETWRARMAEELGVKVDDVRVIDVYTVAAGLDEPGLLRARDELFTDPVIQVSSLDEPLARDYDYLIEVGFRPGVTDNVGKSAAEGIEDIVGRAFTPSEKVFKSTQYVLRGGALDEAQCDAIARNLLANALIQRWAIRAGGDGARNGRRLLDLPIVTDRSDAAVHTVDLERDDKALLALSRECTWALDLREMKAIQAYYRDETVRARREAAGLPANATDVEMEILAQTWSEHCKHKIFAARIDYTGPDGEQRTINGLFREYIKGTTDAIAQHIDWLVSVFHDNAGIVKFDEQWNLALKAETHNSPSALDPYGGAMTGIVGVNRDILGAGMGCRCLFNTDVFCFAPPDYAGEIPPRLFHPRRVFRGVHRGVQDGGNQSGIPTVNGAIVFHERFLGKPLVFCGTGGLIPAKIAGKPSEVKRARPGDVIVMAGGRIGKDGIHGATFSSEALHAGSPATAVQIGDPITQKKLSDFLLEARDKGLYSNVTDNGAGGLSSSIGEMARGSGGAEVHLDRAPLKYPGLAPWEIFLSEAQERMTFGVPPENIDTFLALAERRDVEATAIGTFTDSGRLECTFDRELVASLDMKFLHEGVPQMELRARWNPPRRDEPKPRLKSDDLIADLKAVLASWNVCSKEALVRRYDHEVQANTVLKPFQGVDGQGPGDAAVIRPVHGSTRGIAVACGIAPKYSDLDTYAMMAASVDEAVRNLICVGARFGTVAGLDNFCWPDPVQSADTPDGEHKLAQLVRACEALREACIAYGIPLISGKDSMKNDYRIGDTKISIPPTVLFTASGIVDDVRKAVTMDVKRPGDVVYVLGETRDELGGSEYLALQGIVGDNPPQVDFASARALYERLSAAIAQGLVASCHDCSDGGLGVALAESAFAGGYGIDADLSTLGIDNLVIALFSESQSRFVVTVREQDTARFEQALAGAPLYRIGSVIADPTLTIHTPHTTAHAPLATLKEAWQRPLRW